MSTKKKSKVVQASQLIVEYDKPSKDDVLGPYKKHVASFEENSCYTEFDSFELLEEGHQNDGDKELLTRETNSSDGEDVSFSTENGITLLANPNGKRGFNQLKNPSPTPDHVEHVQPSCCRESSKILIPWLIQATQQVQAPNTPQLFPEVGGKYPHTARTSFLINHLVPRFPIVSYDHSSMISCSRMESSVAPFIPSLPVIKPTSVNLSQRNGMKSKIVSTQDLVISQKARKRPAVEEDYLMKSTKVRNLGIRDESRATKPFLNSAQFISHIITQ
ncbi:hypothetical protein V6N13_028493 [Hibiscus sabdariffa]